MQFIHYSVLVRLALARLKDVEKFEYHCPNLWFIIIQCQSMIYGPIGGQKLGDSVPCAKFTTLDAICHHVTALAEQEGCLSDDDSPRRIGSSSNLHATDDSNDLVQTKNFIGEDRYNYFFADAPHLVKTLRNYMNHSGHGDKFSTLAVDELDQDIKFNP